LFVRNGMIKAKKSGCIKGHRFLSEVVSYAVWAYLRFQMSFCDVGDLLYKRGVIVSYETLRSWVRKFGHLYAKVIRRDRPAQSDKWHLD
jgi:putative transposase